MWKILVTKKKKMRGIEELVEQEKI